MKLPALKNIAKKPIVRVLSVILGLLLAQPAYNLYLIAATPAVIRSPKLEHYHFRMQILVDGKAQDFSADAYQEGYAKDQCNANLTEHPIHFHDKKDQIVHIHWEGMTGGLVTKYYGWDFIGGSPDTLGYRLEKITSPKRVPIHGKLLPAPSHSFFYVYTGDENSFKERSFDDWKNQDLEEFFGVTSNSPAHKINKGETSLFNKIFPKVYAHGAEHETEGTEAPETEADKLTRINNLIGNVVIFAQKDKPTDQQVKDRFNRLEPLTDSTCGG